MTTPTDVYAQALTANVLNVALVMMGLTVMFVFLVILSFRPIFTRMAAAVEGLTQAISAQNAKLEAVKTQVVELRTDHNRLSSALEDYLERTPMVVSRDRK